MFIAPRLPSTLAQWMEVKLALRLSSSTPRQFISRALNSSRESLNGASYRFHSLPDTINAMVRFFYTGRIPFHDVHKFTLRQDVEEAYDLAIHVYSQAVYSDITKMKDQATEYMTSLFPYMEPTL